MILGLLFAMTCLSSVEQHNSLHIVDSQRREHVEIIPSGRALLESGHASLRDIIESRIAPTDEDLASDESLDEWMMREATTGQHISGTCKMGPAGDSMAVVDQYGRLHGLEGLHVADASIMPDCIRANTDVTAMMIGERVADFIVEGIQP